MILAALFTTLFILNVVALDYFVATALKRKVLLDLPNERSSHRTPRVRGAGIVFVISALMCWFVIDFVFQSTYLALMACGALLVAFVSFVDDVRGLPIQLRLYVHLLAALIFLSAVPIPNFLIEWLGPWSVLWYPLAMFFIVAITNLYNFMDGIDGIAALHCLLVFSLWLVFASGGQGLGLEFYLCLSIAVPLVAFLSRNWSPARCFMGDTGSTFLGFTLACLAVVQVPGSLRSSNFTTLIILMMPFLFDSTAVLIARFLQREKWYEGHQKHFFHRLVASGLSHAHVTTLYGAMTIYGGAVLLLAENNLLPTLPLGPVLLILPYVALYLYTAHRASVQQPRLVQTTVTSGLHIEVERTLVLPVRISISVEGERRVETINFQLPPDNLNRWSEKPERDTLDS